MTMTFSAGEVAISGVGGFRNLDGSYQQTKLALFYNTDGSFVLSMPDEQYKGRPFGGPHVKLWARHFDEVVRAFEESGPRGPFDPFYKAVIQGGMTMPLYTFGYLVGDKKGLVLEQRLLSYVGVPCKQLNQVCVTVPEFREAQARCAGFTLDSAWG